ncbi:hypothetical protein ABIC27_004548 [Streptomyces sp. PvR034]
MGIGAGRGRRAPAVDVLAPRALCSNGYATGLERVREVRRALGPWEHERYVRDLDDRLYAWGAVVSAIAR